MYIDRSIDLSIYLSIYLSIHPSIHPSIYLSISLSIYISLSIHVHIYIYIYTHLFRTLYTNKNSLLGPMLRHPRLAGRVEALGLLRIPLLMHQVRLRESPTRRLLPATCPMGTTPNPGSWSLARGHDKHRLAARRSKAKAKEYIPASRRLGRSGARSSGPRRRWSATGGGWRSLRSKRNPWCCTRRARHPCPPGFRECVARPGADPAVS